MSATDAFPLVSVSHLESPAGLVATSLESMAEGIAADYDAEGKLAGIEILDAVKRFGGKETLSQVVIEGFGPATQP